MSVKSTAALFRATVSFYCQSLIAKEHTQLQLKDWGKILPFYLAVPTTFSPLFLKCFILWVKLNETTKKKESKLSCQTAPKSVCRDENVFSF